MDDGQVREKLLRGLEDVFERSKFLERAEEIRANAVARIIKDTMDGTINWKRDLRRYAKHRDWFVSTVTVKDRKGEDIVLPATIEYYRGELDPDANEITSDAYLYLGDGRNGDGDFYKTEPLTACSGNSDFKGVLIKLHIIPPEE